MILKRLTATGFKSFADKTEFDFGGGITGIVGPNGCGKSNVVDAIKWVLGEQSAKSLRGKQMMDVIFNGSGTRKSLGMAQVDLTFDNSDGRLPTDQTEVTVSRRLYRSGESEYLLNKQVCRLKDIRELFLDTGIGVDAYSVIEQGRVDVLLQANPTERRLIFEEAAGISKYKVRKKEAQRRLERVNQNLLRVQDIVEEVEKRLRSVKLAAGKARNYQAYVQELRELRSRYALAEYHRLREGRDAAERESTELSDRATQLRTDLSNNEARSSEANVGIVDLERAISLTENRLLTATSQITAQEERIAAAERRIADQKELLARSQERLGGFDGQVASLDGRLAEQDAIIKRIEAELAAVHGELSRLADKDRTCAHETNETSTRLEDEKAGIIDLLRRTSQLHNEIQGLDLQHGSLARQKSQLDERDAAIATELAEAMGRQQSHRARLGEIDVLIADQSTKLNETKEKADVAASHRVQLIDQLAAAKEYRSGLESRRQLLAEQDRKHEGLLAGAREILERRDGDESGRTFNYVRGAVGELFEADVAHAGLVEAVLGNYEKYLVVAQRESLLADRDTLADLSGPVRAFSLDCVPPLVNGPDLSNQEGFVARLIDWVRFPEDCAQLARYLLGRTYVVESIDAARRLAAMDPAGARFVTVEGIVWEPDGRVGIGPLGAGSGLISRRSELRELAKELASVEERIASLSEQLRTSESEVSHLEQVQQSLRTAIYEANTQRVESAANLATVDETVRQLSDERPLIAREVAVLVDQLGEMRTRQEASRQSLTQLETRSSESERMVEQLTAALAELQTRRQQIGEAITSAKVRSGELTQQRAAANESARELQSARVQLLTERDQAARDVVEAQERIEQSQGQMAAAKQALDEHRTQHAALSREAAELRTNRDNLRSEVEQLAIDARRLRSELEAVEAQLHERQLKLQELRVRLEDLVGRIQEELHVDLEAQYAGYAPQDDEDWPAVEAKIEELRQKIERLGSVNLDAIDEQGQLETRLEFLTGQLTDLRTSEKQLLELIDRLNVESQQRFIDTFKGVAEHFSALFKKLFGGGKAELLLMDEADVLECGIEIVARPPGKEPQSISLLSGGEKTMTAIALLMAVFRHRPSPFVLLDEVDAALDEANNVRFNHVVEEFSKISQFIVITHSKRTMSIADTMYGVTMQEAGVSKRVSVRFDDEQQKASA
ncbi:Chromosome partition protein Smc [Phycisphaerae bacterium RAS2]|nr:Chromosome partition protein Smc [Phycisphaerae bacterium RAS2]